MINNSAVIWSWPPAVSGLKFLRTVALPPLSTEVARDMIDGLRIGPLLDGRRGMPAADRNALCGALVRFSMLAADLGDLIDEMDVNPLIVSERGCVAVDALVIGRGGGTG